jgi:hypothetical protein
MSKENMPLKKDELDQAISNKEIEFKIAEAAGRSTNELNGIYQELKKLRIQLDLLKPEMKGVAKKLNLH